jgi:hypothetical protein
MNLQDQTTPPIDFYFVQATAVPTTLAVAVGDPSASLIYDVEVTDATNCNIGDYFGLFNSDSPSENRAFFAEILNKVGDVLTLDTPVDFDFQIGNTAACFTRDLNVNGSVTPQIFAVQVGSGATQSIDITRVMIQITTTDPPAFDEFGDIETPAPLTNGLVFRRVNGDIRSIWNVKSNGEFTNLAYDVSFYLQTGPQAVNGIGARNTFAGQDKHGVALRIAPGDAIQMIVQDDLSSLVSFRIVAQGHYVSP